jgi:hypothetical protein
MNNHVVRLVAATGLIAGLAVAPVGAQTAPASNVAARGTELGASIGSTSTSSETAPLLAGTADWSLTRWVRIEARGGWFARGTDASGVSADLGAHVNAFATRQATPYFGAAFGLYRAMIGSPATGVSSFYRTRMAEQSAIGPWQFTDPAWRFSAGVDIVARRHISVRPEASVMLVHGHGATDTLTLLEVRIGYKFEDHPVTPSTGR